MTSTGSDSPGGTEGDADVSSAGTHRAVTVSATGLVSGALIAFAIGQFLVGLDISVMSVALPSIQREFGVGMAQLQWAVMAYMVAGAALAVPVGAMGDAVGRRRLYLLGATLFAIGSAISAASPNIEILIVGRAVQGIGSGAMGTLALAMLTSSVAHEQIPKLLGIWTAITAGASALGPLIGGGLVSALGWRWVFWINVVLMALVIPLVARKAPKDTRSAQGGHVDWLGSALLTIALILIAGGLGLLENETITSPSVWGPVVAGLAVVGILGVQQRRSKAPLTDWAAIRVPPIPATLILLVLLSMVLSGAMLQQTMLVQNVLGFAPLVAGLVGFGASAMLVFFSPISPVVMRRIGLGPTVGIGLGLTSVGLFGLSTINDTTTPMQVAVWLSIMGMGLGFGMPAASAGAMSSIPKQSMGAVSGFMSLISSVSAVLGIAVVGGLSANRTEQAWATLGAKVADAESLVGQVVSGAIPELRSRYGEDVAKLAGEAYTSGVTEALLIAAVGVGVAAVLAVFLLGRRGRTSAPRGAPGRSPTVTQ
jgi:EmrB/QacA subfamily drug resistance transporter